MTLNYTRVCSYSPPSFRSSSAPHPASSPTELYICSRPDRQMPTFPLLPLSKTLSQPASRPLLSSHPLPPARFPPSARSFARPPPASIWVFPIPNGETEAGVRLSALSWSWEDGSRKKGMSVKRRFSSSDSAGNAAVGRRQLSNGLSPILFPLLLKGAVAETETRQRDLKISLTCISYISLRIQQICIALRCTVLVLCVVFFCEHNNSSYIFFSASGL